jgi:sugar phosphate isomerase/epimerase
MSRFILSCTTCAARIPGRDEISECFIHAPRAGYKAWGAQSPLFWWPGMTRWANIDLINECARDAGLERCTEVYGAAFPNGSVAEAQRAAGFRAQLFDVAIKMGSPLVVITGRPRTDDGLEPIIAGVRALLPLIEYKPVRLALEPHFGSQIQFFEDYEAIFEQIESPQVGITLDSGHFHCAGVDWKRLIHRYPERIYNFHIKDHVGTQSVPLGTGEIDLRGYIEELHAIGYEGALAVELEVVDLENLPRYCSEAFHYLRDLVKEVTGRFPE